MATLRAASAVDEESRGVYQFGETSSSTDEMLKDLVSNMAAAVELGMTRSLQANKTREPLTSQNQ